MVRPYVLFCLWFAFVLIIYMLSGDKKECVLELTGLNAIQIISLVVLFISRSNVLNVIAGSAFIIANFFIFRILDPFPSSVGMFLGLASSITAMLTLVNIKKRR